MLRTRNEIEEEAISWVIRLKDADHQDWEAFASWLEADPAHAKAYDEIALCDADAEEIFAPLSAARPVLPVYTLPGPVAAERRAGRRAFLGWGIAASLVLMSGYAAIRSASGPYSIETGPGERREVALADGSRIELNGSTKIMLDEDRPRFARLDQGEALFNVMHSSTSPFEVEAGDAVLRDLGTTFNVVRQAGLLDVAVSEGAVLYNPGREATNLQAGMGLRREKDEEPWVGKVEPREIGAWREGRLVYTGMRVSRIASDLERNLGVPVKAATNVSSRQFSGIILLEGDRVAVLNRAAALLGLRLDRKGTGWILTAGAGEAS